MASANPMLASILVWATGAVAVGGAAAPFASPMRLKLPTGFRPTAALTADVNADGAGDFVVAGDAGQLVAFLSDARGGFRMSPPTPCGAHPSSLAAGDLTRDGHLDVVVANHETDYITLLVGDGAGVFAARQLRLHSNPHPHGVAIGDFDGDARLDIVVDSWAENHLTLLLGANEWRGPGTAIDVGRKPYWTITAADVDGDGKSDVVTPNEGRGTVSVLLGDGRAGFAHAPGSPLAGGLVPFAATVADLNGDKRPDIAIANYSGHADNTANDGLTWIRNDGQRHFTPIPERVATGRYTARLAAADVNGDGYADVAFSNSASDTVRIVYGSPSGPKASDEVQTMRSPNALALADFNRDGRADLLVTGEESDEVRVFFARL